MADTGMERLAPAVANKRKRPSAEITTDNVSAKRSRLEGTVRILMGKASPVVEAICLRRKVPLWV